MGKIQDLKVQVAESGITTETQKDKYGRTVKSFFRTTESGRKLRAVVVTLPQTYLDKYPEEGRYLANLNPSAGDYATRMNFTYKLDAEYAVVRHLAGKE